ncbi:hypothetical protein ACFFRR_009701 [Megaselia abdita]
MKSFLFFLIFLIKLRFSTELSPAYETAYACERKFLKINCPHKNFISVVRANFGRFSITICNEHGNVDWSVNCASQQSFSVLSKNCAGFSNCSISATTEIFGDPCPGTLKYLEVHYKCLSSISSTTTVSRPPTTISRPQPQLFFTTTTKTTTMATTTATVPTTTTTTTAGTTTTTHLSTSFIQSTSTGIVASTRTVPTTISCPAKRSRGLFWNQTTVNELSVQPCPGGATGIAKWRCRMEKRNGENIELGVWFPETPELTQCRSVWLNSLEIRVGKKENSLISIAGELAQVTKKTPLYGGDLLVSTKIIQVISEKFSYDIETFPDQKQRENIIIELLHLVLSTCSNLLAAEKENSWKDLSEDDQRRVAGFLLSGLEDNAFLLAEAISRERRNFLQTGGENIFVEIRVLETKSILTHEIFPDKDRFWNETVTQNEISLPKQSLIENSDGGLVRIVFSTFNRLEEILKFDGEKKIISKVISASLGKGRHIQLSQPIKIRFRHLSSENVTNPVCVFWNFIEHTWSTDGCHLIDTNRTHSTCQCNHLTNFALLAEEMDTNSIFLNTSLVAFFTKDVRVLLYISIGVVAIFTTISACTLKLFESTRKCILKNFYICLVFLELTFLIGIEQSESSVFCGFTTVFVHSFCLSTIAWFSFHGYYFYKRNIAISKKNLDQQTQSEHLQSTNNLPFYLLSYGLSFSIVAISLFLKPDAYTRNDFCVLLEDDGPFFYAVFLIPAVLYFSIGIGLAIYGLLISKSTTDYQKNREKNNLRRLKFDLQCSLFFLTVFVLNLIFAFLCVRYWNDHNDHFQLNSYLFVTCNSTMGMLVFVLHCIQNEKIRLEYGKYVDKKTWIPRCLRCSTESMNSNISCQQQQTVEAIQPSNFLGDRAEALDISGGESPRPTSAGNVELNLNFAQRSSNASPSTSVSSEIVNLSGGKPYYQPHYYATTSRRILHHHYHHHQQQQTSHNYQLDYAPINENRNINFRRNDDEKSFYYDGKAFSKGKIWRGKLESENPRENEEFYLKNVQRKPLNISFQKITTLPGTYNRENFLDDPVYEEICSGR